MLRTAHAFSERFRGSRELAGSDLSGYDFTAADMRDVDLHDCNLAGTSVSLANLRGANLDGVKWGATGHAADLRGASMRDVHWLRGGLATRGIVFPQYLPFETWTGGNDSHAVIAKVLEQTYPDDPEVESVVNFILAQPQRFAAAEPFPCWESSVLFVLSRVPHRTDDILAAFDQFPAMGLHGRWDVGLYMLQHPSVEDRKKLMKTDLYQTHRDAILLGIRQARRAVEPQEETV